MGCSIHPVLLIRGRFEQVNHSLLSCLQNCCYFNWRNMAEIFNYFGGGDKIKKKKQEAQKRKLEESSQEYRQAKKRKNDNVYDIEKRTRTFQESWQTKHSWLEFERTKNIMFCSACREFSDLADPTSAFVKDSGCNNFRIDAVDKHGKSNCHKAVLAKKCAVEAAPGN